MADIMGKMRERLGNDIEKAETRERKNKKERKLDKIK